MRERGFGRVVAIGSMAVREPIDALQLSNAHRPRARRRLQGARAPGCRRRRDLQPRAPGTDRHQPRDRHRRLARSGAGAGEEHQSGTAGSAPSRSSPPPPSSCPRSRLPTSTERPYSWTARSLAASDLDCSAARPHGVAVSTRPFHGRGADRSSLGVLCGFGQASSGQWPCAVEAVVALRSSLSRSVRPLEEVHDRRAHGERRRRRRRPRSVGASRHIVTHPDESRQSSGRRGDSKSTNWPRPAIAIALSI